MRPAAAADGWLLDLAAGVTSVRDMAGFPWMLAARDMINSRRMLAPAYSVAGPLINGFGMEGYSVVPANSADARRIVRQEAACGYDFIKVHNIVPGPIFDAVNEQAKALGMDVVGHVPHHVTVRRAVEAGMRTMEHLKGFIDDATLKAGETDFAAAVGKEVWNTPTLYAGRGYAHGDEARKLLRAPEMRYTPLRKREKWSWHRSTGRPVDARARGPAAHEGDRRRAAARTRSSWQNRRGQLSISAHGLRPRRGGCAFCRTPVFRRLTWCRSATVEPARSAATASGIRADQERNARRHRASRANPLLDAAGIPR
jgi:hypothetical protein